MSWENVELKDINPLPELIPEGKYTFQLLGAELDQRDPSRLVVRAAIVTDGDFQGRRLIVDYPDPERYDWSLKALKRLEIAIGVDQAPGETVVGFLNRAVNSRFQGTVYHDRSYTPEGETEPRVRARLRHFSVQPSA